ncbi:MAG: hypothetical protein A2W80_03155 [Candidatus Riflebacteria bacterium GWC2_50_8]|nr:MAG: hypothetical protein A2W80_03155 [Candidatus Riflebacteria bacterium GWC2_50_8]
MPEEVKLKPVVIGFGESEDPMPERPQLTGYRIFAGPCKDCGCAGRKLLPAGSSLVIICDKCRAPQKTNLAATDWPEITYIYWCNSSKFASDQVELSIEDQLSIEQTIAALGTEYEMPHWAVMVVAGRCSCSEQCVNFACPYLARSS